MLALLEQARQGSRTAAVELFEEWKGRVLRIVRLQLTWPLRRLYDSDEFLQEVTVELWTHDIAPEVFESPERFMDYVTGLAVNKFREARERYHAQKRALRRDVVAAVRERLRKEDAERERARAAEHDQQLDQQAELARLERGLPARYRAIIRLRLRGWTQKAIAKFLNICERTVRRVWQKVVDSARTPKG